MMNVEQGQAAAGHQTEQTDVFCESAGRLLSSIPTIAIHSVEKLGHNFW